ncbi:MAG: aminotransferase class V-fold PLP-dependent enzyme [Chloroflexi bacterium]|nr:aminotransferase class V-fold PLP-dependent enzyme [Chloroflexota bacterium]
MTGVKTIYLDNAATSWPKPEAVYRAMDDFMRRTGASPGRSGHRLSIEAGRVAYDTREALAMLFGVRDPTRIVFTANATEALNVVIRGMLHPGDHVITSGMEHNSVMRPLRAAEQAGVRVTVVPYQPAGTLQAGGVERAIGEDTRLIVLSHASNVAGNLLPIAEAGLIARKRGVTFLVDAAQTAGCCAINVEAMNIDVLAFSGHKGLYGPQGTGGLYIRQGMESRIRPLKHGGTGSRSESEYQPEFLPDKYESGTPNTVGLAGLCAGVRFVLEQGGAIQRRERELAAALLQGLGGIPGVVVHGQNSAEGRIAVISFNISGLTPSEVSMGLEEHGILCRPGLHCSPAAHRTLGTFPQGTARLSPGYFTSDEDIEAALQAVREIAARGAGG